MNNKYIALENKTLLQRGMSVDDLIDGMDMKHIATRNALIKTFVMTHGNVAKAAMRFKKPKRYILDVVESDKAYGDIMRVVR